MEELLVRKEESRNFSIYRVLQLINAKSPSPWSGPITCI